MTEQEFNELMKKSKSELLEVVQCEDRRHGIRGVSMKNSKFEIVTHLHIIQCREDKYGKVK